MWNFRKLDVWKRAIDLADRIYEVTALFPESEKYGLTNQLRRAVVSISANIAEGCGRRTSKDFIQFLHNAGGSVKEIESELVVAERLKYLSEDNMNELVVELNEIGKMLLGLMRHVSRLGIK